MAHVLIVDDNLVIVELLAGLLETAGHVVIRVGDPAELLNIHDPHWHGADVLLCDLMMPTPGIRIVKTAELHFPDIYRLVLTALSSATSDLFAEATQHAHRVLRKPEDVSLVVELITAWGAKGG